MWLASLFGALKDIKPSGIALEMWLEFCNLAQVLNLPVPRWVLKTIGQLDAAVALATEDANNKRESFAVEKNGLCPCGSGKTYRECCAEIMRT